MRNLVTVIALFLGSACLFAQDPRWDAGVRANIVTASGEPANDILSTGLYVHYYLSNDWALGFAYDRADYDFERPWLVLGFEQDPDVEVIDTTTESTVISAWGERLYGSAPHVHTWFLGAGLGHASPDVADVQGPLANGGTFDITTDAGTEILAMVSAGVRRHFGNHISVELALRLDHHFAEWDVLDRVSGRTAQTGDYTAYGLHVGFGTRF